MLDKRIKQLNNLVKKDPNNTLFLFTLGLEYLKSGNAEKAIVPLKKAIELNPNYSAAYRAPGKAFTQIECTNEAIGIYQKGIMEIAESVGDLQAKKEMPVFLKRLFKEKS